MVVVSKVSGLVGGLVVVGCAGNVGNMGAFVGGLGYVCWVGWLVVCCLWVSSCLGIHRFGVGGGGVILCL